MARLLTAEDIMPLVSSLPASERIRLLRLMASPPQTDASADEEFDDDPLAWEAEGWEEFS